MKTLNIILVGFGNVGRSFLRLCQEKMEFCRNRYRLDLRVQAIFELGGALFASQPLKTNEILKKYSSPSSLPESPDWKADMALTDIFHSVKPGVLVLCTASSLRDGEPGLAYIRQALDRGWNVAAADKAPLVLDFRNLKEKATQNRLTLKCSAAAAAALPTLDISLYSLAGSEIKSIEGILNGTTNYILTRMREGIDYEQALREARSKGIAEPDPSYDVNGWDTASKILIIVNSVLDTNFSLKDVKVEGITRIPSCLLDQGKEKGRALKLLGRIYRQAEKLRLEVSLNLIDSSHPLYGVDGTEKGITYLTDTMGSLTVKGGKSDPKGAAAALLKDIINIYWA